MLDQDADANPDLEQLRGDLVRLREDLSRITATAAGIAKARLRQAACRRADGVQKDLAAAAERVNARIDAYPAVALLTAFGVGLVLSRLLGRRR